MNTTAAPPLYTVHEADPTLVRDEVLSIWQGSLKHERGGHEAKYAWFYLAGDGGPPLLELLRHEPTGDWVGTCAAGRRRMVVGGQEIRGGVIVDFAVRAEHRSLGPALTLQQGLVDAGTRHLDLLYGFPNPKAVAAIKRAGFTPVAELISFLRVVRYGPILARYMPRPLAAIAGGILSIAGAPIRLVRRLFAPRIHVEWSDTADERMDTLWRDSGHEQVAMMVRDAAYARWRFDKAPTGTTRYLFLSDSPHGTMHAWFATRSDGGFLRVLDFWSDDATGGMSRHRIDALLRAAASSGHAAVTLELAGPEACLDSWRSRGFIERRRGQVFGRWSTGGAEGPVAYFFLTTSDKDG